MEQISFIELPRQRSMIAEKKGKEGLNKVNKQP